MTGSAFQTRQDPEKLSDAPGLRGAALGRVRGIAVEELRHCAQAGLLEVIQQGLEESAGVIADVWALAVYS